MIQDAGMVRLYVKPGQYLHTSLTMPTATAGKQALPLMLAGMVSKSKGKGGAMKLHQLPDLSDWQKVEVWTVDEAALLWSAIDPDSLIDTHINFNQSLLGQLFDSITPAQERKAKIYRRAIIEAICGGTLSFARAIELHNDYQNGEWVKEISFPDLPDPEKIISSRTRVQQAAFIKWAKSKNILSYREQVTRANSITKDKEVVGSIVDIPQTENVPLLLPAARLLTADHPRAPRELLVAVAVWEEVVTNGHLDKNGKSLKSNARKILDTDKKYSDTSEAARERISQVVNADKNGGAPKTPG